MKKYLFLALFSCVSFFIWAQTFSIGHTTKTFQDVNRSNRAVKLEIYYPANTAGNDVALANGTFPIIAFGHGFVMAVSSYQNVVDAVVPQGYIIALVDTEGGISPNHSEYGKDLAFTISALQAENTVVGSLFHAKIGSTSAVMGHSMGGGASFLAAGSTPSITCIAAFAPAETNPSAIAAAANIAQPTLIFAGEKDCVTPTADHQTPMYNATLASCKSYIEIKGASHCKFANSSFTCSLGETTCMGTLTNAQQHTIAFRYLLPFLNTYLKNASTWTNTIAQANTDTDLFLSKTNCPTTIGIEHFNTESAIKISPNPANNGCFLVETPFLNYQYTVFDIQGKRIMQSQNIAQSTLRLDFNTIGKGIYILEIINEKGDKFYAKLVH